MPKADYDTMEQQKKQLETTVGDYKTQMESLKTAAGDNEYLKKQIADLQEQNANKDKEHKKELDDLEVDMSPLFETIISYIPAPEGDPELIPSFSSVPSTITSTWAGSGSERSTTVPCGSIRTASS